jgi:hypothetical protein
MKFKLSILFLLFGQFGCSGITSAELINYEMNSEKTEVAAPDNSNTTWVTELNYPIFKNSVIANELNNYVSAALNKYLCPEGGDSFVDVNVTYQSKNLVSILHKGAYMCAGMPSTRYSSGTINIDLKTLKKIKLTDIIKKNKLKKFYTLVLPKINKAIINEMEYEACKATKITDFNLTNEGITTSYSETVEDLPYPCNGNITITRKELKSFITPEYEDY